MNDVRARTMELVFGRWRSQILYAGVRLGLLDAVGQGAASSREVAARRALDPERTYRLMRALGSIGLLRERPLDRFALTPEGEVLTADHPESLRGMALLEEGPQHYRAWLHLCDIVRDAGRDGFRREFGRPLFEHVAADPEYGAVFDDAMTSFSAGESAMVLDALATCDLSAARQVCDVAGGLGHLLCSLLVRHPHLSGTVIDLPSVIERTGSRLADRMGVADRCRYLVGDMFRAVPQADVYLLKHILHDWNDDECARILSVIGEAAKPAARIFVAEYLVPGPETPHFAKLFDIHMMCVLTGRERTEAEYVALFERSGLRHARTWPSTRGPLSVVEAVRG